MQLFLLRSEGIAHMATLYPFVPRHFRLVVVTTTIPARRLPLEQLALVAPQPVEFSLAQTTNDWSQFGQLLGDAPGNVLVVAQETICERLRVRYRQQFGIVDPRCETVFPANRIAVIDFIEHAIVNR